MIRFSLHGEFRGKNPNGREMWAVKAKRIKQERARVHGNALVDLGGHYLSMIRALPKPVIVTLTRTGVRLMDSDNLAGVCAAVRDELAQMLGITDGPTDLRAEWRVAQRKGEPGIDVEIRSAVANESAA